MKEFYFELVELVEFNRSLAENDPMNLLKFIEAKKAYEILGPKRFKNLIYCILDDLE